MRAALTILSGVPYAQERFPNYTHACRDQEASFAPFGIDPTFVSSSTLFDSESNVRTPGHLLRGTREGATAEPADVLNGAWCTMCLLRQLQALEYYSASELNAVGVPYGFFPQHHSDQALSGFGAATPDARAATPTLIRWGQCC